MLSSKEPTCDHPSTDTGVESVAKMNICYLFTMAELSQNPYSHSQSSVLVIVQSKHLIMHHKCCNYHMPRITKGLLLDKEQ